VLVPFIEPLQRALGRTLQKTAEKGLEESRRVTAELQAMADRWAVVELLERGLPYREIHRQTGVSVTTIGRVARYLVSGNGGYRAVTDRLKLNA